MHPGYPWWPQWQQMCDPQMCWGWDCGWDKGAQPCATGSTERRKTRGPSAQDTGIGWPCVLQAWIHKYFAATPVCDKPSLADCLSVCLGTKSPHWTKGVIYLWWWQCSPERGATAQPWRPWLVGALPGLCFAFFHLSHSNKGPGKEAAAARTPQTETDGAQTAGWNASHFGAQRSTLPKWTWDVCWFSFLLEILKYSSKEKSTFFSWFWFAAGLCPFLTWFRSCGKHNVLCLWRVHTIPTSCSLMENSKPFIGLGMDKESLVACGALSCRCFFFTCAHKSPKGPWVPIGNRSVKLITKNINSGGKKMSQEGGKTERSQRDAIYWAWFMMLAGISLPEPDESDSFSVRAGTTVILVLPWAEQESVLGSITGQRVSVCWNWNSLSS